MHRIDDILNGVFQKATKDHERLAERSNYFSPPTADTSYAVESSSLLSVTRA